MSRLPWPIDVAGRLENLPSAYTGEAVIQQLDAIYSVLEIVVLRTGALALLTIYVYKQIRKHWRAP